MKKVPEIYGKTGRVEGADVVLELGHLQSLLEILLHIYKDPPCTLNWGYVVPNSRYLGPNRG